jgi:hypothetical protein
MPEYPLKRGVDPREESVEVREAQHVVGQRKETLEPAPASRIGKRVGRPPAFPAGRLGHHAHLRRADASLARRVVRSYTRVADARSAAFALGRAP